MPVGDETAVFNVPLDNLLNQNRQRIAYHLAAR